MSKCIKPTNSTSRAICFCGHPERDHCTGEKHKCKRRCCSDDCSQCSGFHANPMRIMPVCKADTFDMYNDSQSKSVFRDTGYPGA